MKKSTKKIKKVYLIFLLVVCPIIVFSQIHTDMVKYWYYRNRLNNYFVVPGEKQGESQIICVRNRLEASNDHNPSFPLENFQSKNVDYGQHGKYQGLYIGVLATEYYLLYNNGQYGEAAHTQDELYKALNAVKVYWDEKAEDFWSLSTMPNKFNGFFIRGNVPCDFFSQKQTKSLIS
jgi:hypothetical protein